MSKTKNMVAFRVSHKLEAMLKVMAKLYGAPSVSAFFRDWVDAGCSGDMKKFTDFLNRLQTAQLALLQQRAEKQQQELFTPKEAKKVR